MAVTPFRVQKRSRIVWCIVDNTSRCQSGWAREVNVNLSDHMLFKFNMFGYDILIGGNEDELLHAATNYDYAVIIASGTSFNLSDNIFPAVEELCKKDFFIAGQFIDRGETYPELHHQFYVVNICEYISLGFPHIGAGKEFNSLDAKWHGWNVVPVALRNGKLLIDVGEKIRNSKKYLYYEYDHVFLKELPNIYYNQFFASNFFAAWNSDQLLKSISFTGPVEQYVTVGIGVNWVKNLELVGYTNNTTVIFTDINHSCLKFMESMINDWDGIDYVDFYKRTVPMLPNGQQPLSQEYFDSVRREWEEFISTFDNWLDTWNRIKALNYKFVLINYTATYNFDWLEPGKNTLMNLSDLFTHTPYVFVTSLKYRIACENRLITALSNYDPNVTLMLTSRPCHGFLENNQLVDKVSNFVLTDINLLNKPAWHQEDWSSMKMLG